MPIGLGSGTALAITVILIAMLVLRLLDEEKLLRAELPGYAEYCARVQWRLVPKVHQGRARGKRAYCPRL